MQQPPLERVLILAPHPDDDVIAAGGLIQRAIAAGGLVRVLYVTSGEKNDWPQRAMLRKWRITAQDRTDWTRLRATEALASLEILGVAPSSAVFLGYRDQELTRLARDGDDRLRDDIAAHVSSFEPTLMVVPSIRDVHTDHRALSFFAHRAAHDPARIATYVIHGRPQSLRALFTIHLTEEEQKRKRKAIAMHESQLLLSRERFLSYARATETFYGPEFAALKIDSAFAEKWTLVRHAIRAVFGARAR